MRLFRLFACVLCLAPWLRAAAPAVPQPLELSRLTPHPRLVACAADWAALATRRAQDPRLEAYVQVLLGQAREQLRGSPLEHKLQGKRLLFVSRELIQRVLLFSFAFRVTGERPFLEKARADMLAVSAFSDWNPSHFLDVAEMSAGVAIGYDWLFDELSVEDRAVLRRALIEKALKHGERGNPTFTKDNNWAQVCGGGLSLAALAIGDEEPALAGAVLAQVRAGLAHPLAVYAPDGCYPEGPSYWGYGTMYHVVLVAALRSALGEEWGILKSPGFLRSAEFQAQCCGPKGRLFNFADSSLRDGVNETLCYLARELRQPALAWNTLRILETLPAKGEGRPERFGTLLAFWWPFGPAAEKSAEPALFFTGRGPNAVAIWRSSWTDKKARYFAIKAGGSGVSHGHMDGGSFVLDWQGKRWASDLGMQEYNALEVRGIKLWDMSQDSQRWGIFRLGSTAHNTLTLAGERHVAGGLARLVHADKRGAEIDLAPILGAGVGVQATRRVSVEKFRIVLEDELSGLKPGQLIRWAMTTPATISLEPSVAVLTQEGLSLRVVFEGTGVVLADEDISQPKADYDEPNPGMRQVVARIRADASGRVRLRTLLEAAVH